MSREVRRVPLDWKHPTVPNPYWREHDAWRTRKGQAPTTLRRAEDRFVGLMEDYPRSLASWEQEEAALRARTGRPWAFQVEYHLTGYQGRDDAEPVTHPFIVWLHDSEVPIRVNGEDHLHALVLAEHASERPDPADYMPVFDVPAAELGWCLYETVSEGTPITPVFATADELVDHLATVGTDWGGPLRRASAEQIVQNGFTVGSFVVQGGRVLSSTDDADVIAGAVSS